MIYPETLTEQLLFATVRITADLANGDGSVGTGFFFEYALEGDRALRLIVTNKHVISGATGGQIQFHGFSETNGKGGPSGESFLINISDFADIWIPHPSADVDLCAIPYAYVERALRTAGFCIFSLALRSANIPTAEDLAAFSAVEDVLMIGYPNGLYDSVNYLPVVRRGITATHPAADYCGAKKGMVDLACFPGSSGSPILISYETPFAKKSDVKNGGIPWFLGVLYAGPLMNAEGVVQVREVPTSLEAYTYTQMMMHLGYYIKSNEVAVLAEHILNGAGSQRF